MNEQLSSRQTFLREAEECIGELRDILQVQPLVAYQLTAAQQALNPFNLAAGGAEVDSFELIGRHLEKVFLRHSTAQTIPSRIELETVELAVDWLAQLAILYGEDLPEPKSLVAELLYTFDLVERSQDAVSLAELVEQGATPRVDPFLDDPGFDVAERPVPAHQDPFADDPGFGLEFDLLQRTINFVVETRNINTEGDNNLSTKTSLTTSSPAYDLFASDPPLSDEPDTLA